MKFMDTSFESYTNEYGYTVLNKLNPSDELIDAVKRTYGTKKSKSFIDEKGVEHWVINAFLDINIFNGSSTLKVTLSDKEVVRQQPNLNRDTFDDRIGWKRYDKRRIRF